MARHCTKLKSVSTCQAFLLLLIVTSFVGSLDRLVCTCAGWVQLGQGQYGYYERAASLSS